MTTTNVTASTLTVVPMILRGTVHTDHLVEHDGRGGGIAFATPDARAYADLLTLDSPSGMLDMYELTFADVVEYLDALGRRLNLDDNAYLQESFGMAQVTAGLPVSVLEHVYREFPRRFAAGYVRDVAERTIGVDYLDGWVPSELTDGSRFSIRAFGARSVHIMAGNLPLAPAASIIRNAIVRSDAVLKAPSNDPATAAAIVRTMVDFAPDHPLTKHVSVVYWKGGDEEVERRVYSPERLDKIIAWGGESSMRHLRRYIRPGLDLVAMDPKLSATFIGREALVDDAALTETARRLAMDVGGLNQQGCVNARVVYVESGTDAAGLDVLRALGRRLHDAVQALPPTVSGPTPHFDPALRTALGELAMTPDVYEVLGGTGDEGAVVVSLIDEPVDFATILGCRVANLVPVDAIEDATERITSYTQTVGVWPPELKARLRDRMAVHGAQRIPTLGLAIDFQFATVQDGMEMLRRMCTWVVDEDASGHPLSRATERTAT